MTRHNRIVILSNMLKIQSDFFVRVNDLIGGYRQTLVRVLPDHEAAIKNEQAWAKSLIEQAPGTQQRFRQYGLPASANAMGRLVDVAKAGGTSLISVIQRIDHFKEVMGAELSSIRLYQIAPQYTDLMSPDEPLFGAEVFEAFPSAITDIECSGKCIALGQGTASVFHSMRVLEAGLKVLALPLGIPYAPSWESYLKQIEKQIAVKHGLKDAKWKRQEPFFRDLMGDLQIIKMAWRNPTMHIVRHYSTDEAEEVFRATRAFMKRLGARHREKKRR